MSKIYDSEIGRMRELMKYGLNENASNEGKPIVEYHAVGADGKTYGILRECNKFYIKVAPKKDTEILAEDYDYIGGYMNKKSNEYTTYAVASKNFDMKLKQIAESVGSKNAIEQYSKVEPAEWQINETKEMRAEIDRFKQIVSNSARIDEGLCSIVGMASNGGKLGKNEKDGTYSEEAKPDNGKDKNGEVGDNKPGNGNPYTVVAKPDNGEEKPKGKKKSNESVNRTVKLTEEQVLAWNRDNDDFMDKSEGTEVGSSSPYKNEVGCESNQCEADTDPIREGVAMHNSDNQNVPEPGTSERGDDAPYTKNVNEGEEIDPDDVAGMGEDDDEDFDIELDVEPEDDDVEVEDSDFDEDFDEEDEDVPFPEIGGDDGMKGLENWEETWNKFDDDDDEWYSDPFESNRRRGEAIFEVVMDDFGKHPAYRKEPMTIPPHTMSDKHGKDWNDDSAKQNIPFGSKIGKSDPYDEDLVDAITDAIVNMVSKKKD